MEKVSFKDTYRKSPKYFTRERLFKLPVVMTMQINIISKSLRVEVSKFLRRFNLSKKLTDGSKQGYSQARSRIKWEGYVHLNDKLVKEYYSDNELKKYKDKYVLIGTDGTTYQLPYEQALIEQFGVHDNGQGQAKCMAQGLKLYDLLNDLNLVALFERYDNASGKGQSEMACFESSLKRFTSLMETTEFSAKPLKELNNFLFIGDRYYASFYNFLMLPNLGYDYVLRCRTNFCKEIESFCKHSPLDEAWITLDLTLDGRKYGTSLQKIAANERPKSIKVRCIKKTLNNGETLCLVTTVTDLSPQEVCAVFYTRWNEETSFDVDKNKLEVELFSSKTPEGVQHDFYATILTANIAQLIISEAQELVEKEQSNKNNKHPYKVNVAVAIGLLKDEIPLWLTGQQKTESWFKDMVQLVAKHKEPVRRNRSYEKRKKHKLKYPMNKRRVL